MRNKTQPPILPMNGTNMARFFAARERGSVDAIRVAARIVSDVRKRGDAAVIAWTRKFDGVRLKPAEFWVSARKRRAAPGTGRCRFAGGLQRAAGDSARGA